MYGKLSAKIFYAPTLNILQNERPYITILALDLDAWMGLGNYLFGVNKILL